MYAKYRLEVVGDRAADVPRSRNFAEDLHFSLKQRGWGTTSDPDTMTTELFLHIPHKKHHRDAMKLLARLMEQHLMESDINVKQVENGPV